jgi:hypothetical protein
MTARTVRLLATSRNGRAQALAASPRPRTTEDDAQQRDLTRALTGRRRRGPGGRGLAAAIAMWMLLQRTLAGIGRLFRRRRNRPRRAEIRSGDPRR